jgi:hypothetical protein
MSFVLATESKNALVLLPLLVFAQGVAAETVSLYRNTSPGVEYAGSRACAFCHKRIFDRFSSSPMGRSLTPASLPQLPVPATVSVSGSNRRFEVFVVASDASRHHTSDGRLYQSETESAAGETVFSMTQPLAWAIGSGVNGITFAVERGPWLFEAPLSYYAGPGQWNLSPGYEVSDEGFSRPVSGACLVCHAGRPRPAPGRDGMYSTPAFDEPAIGCENCHGPGELHVRERTTRTSRVPDLSIVNPARLPARLAEDICMKCHQAGQARVLLPGREYSDFRPGVPLIRTVAIAEVAGAAKDTALLEHHDAMQSSRCFTASGGKLGCMTCHDPHEQPDAARAPDWFREKCLTCHSNQSCRASLTERNCIACHMPRRPVGTIAHSALTDHRILAKPDARSSAIALPATGGIRGIRILNARDGEPGLPLLTRLELLGTLADQSPLYLQTLEEAARRLPEDPLVLAVLGRRELARHGPDAVRLLAAAEKRETARLGAARISTYADLSDALLQAGSAAEAAATLERAQSAYPWTKDVRKRLVLAYIRQKEYTKSAAALKSYVADFPEDSFMRGLLKQVAIRP